MKVSSGRQVCDTRSVGASDAQQPKRLIHAHREVACALGDVAETVQAHDANHQIPDARHEPGAGAGAHSGTILVEGDIAHIVNSVFDLPMPPVQLKQPRRRGLFGVEAGDPVDYFGSSVAASKKYGVALDAEYLFDMREIKISFQLTAYRDASPLESAVSFVDGGVIAVFFSSSISLMSSSIVGWFLLTVNR